MCVFWLFVYLISDCFEWVVLVLECLFILIILNNIVNKIVVMICLILILSLGLC